MRIPKEKVGRAAYIPFTPPMSVGLRNRVVSQGWASRRTRSTKCQCEKRTIISYPRFVPIQAGGSCWILVYLFLSKLLRYPFFSIFVPGVVVFCWLFAVRFGHEWMKAHPVGGNSREPSIAFFSLLFFFFFCCGRGFRKISSPFFSDTHIHTCIVLWRRAIAEFSDWLT